MEPLIQTMTTTVAQDMRELIHATDLEAPVLLERAPPNWRWHLPLGFVTVVAAGALLIAAAGVQEEFHQQQQGARRYPKTKKHMKKGRPQAAPIAPGAS